MAEPGYHSPFIVMALPRSRTAWLARYLSYRDWECGHDQLRYMRSLDDVKSWLAIEKAGTCETGAAPYWRLLLKYRPDIRVVTIRRPVEEVVESLSKFGLPLDSVRKTMTSLDHKLDQIEGRMPNVKSVRFDDLKDEVTCGEIFEFCVPYRHDREWWQSLESVNIQANFPALMRYVSVNMDAINKLGAHAKRAMFADMVVKPADMRGVTIVEDTVEGWRKDCRDLFEQHCAEVGEHPDNWMNKNWDAFQSLYEIGHLQVMVARSNGKAFGYLMTIISPSLESPDRKCSQHTTFFADKSLPGLGLKLQRASLAALKEKGVYETFMRAGVRGDGERIGSLYKRLGAEEFGKMYRLELGA